MIDKSIKKNNLNQFNSITELSNTFGFSKPLHPFITLVHHADISSESEIKNMVTNFFMISYKSNLKGKLKYGQGYYDFEEGGLIFTSPNQAISVVDGNEVCQGVSVFFHPDFLAASTLGFSIKKYGFFSYQINEALHLSDKEKQKILSIFENIEQELTTSIDEISQDLIISYLEVLLNYSNRYYKRQFVTRKIVNRSIVEKFEDLLSEYFNTEKSLSNGLPTVKYFSDKLNLSSGYLSDLLRNTTGLNTQQHIHSKIINSAKEKLLTSQITAAELAYELGFEHPQSFNKLFKAKTKMSPMQFRQSFQNN
ncbi:helix-turn-helix domain-containing protein [Chryseobacterium polytrichastri]|uniref:AraC-type DNA-binding protein n=1 Tax=Chryseobacterium polytrichastri TaxID=1302687 RepID=A0A1M6Q6X0_9FLAO|nr:helix-turn-helix domain-containing protein [Chryseobacterium polytrichastri]SHK15992.1 AraC-type DNA-binding protein [Chryseobacterium polytrichastri]